MRPPTPLTLSPGPHLFLDEYLVARSEGLRRLVEQPERVAQPLVTGPEDGNFQPYVTVLPSTEGEGYRMWFNVGVHESRSRIGYLESRDGLEWLRPRRVLDDPAPIVFGASVLQGPEGRTKPRYRLAFWNRGMWVAHSDDGLRFARVSTEPAVSDAGDIVSLTFDPVRERYLALFKVHSTRSDGYRGSTPNAPAGYRRLVGQSVSYDGQHWSPARRILAPDAGDEGVTEFYSVGGITSYGELLVGFLRVLRDDLPAEPEGPVAGIGYTVLAWSRDGESWHRDREPFLDRNAEPRTFDRAMAWADAQLDRGEETLLYYGGYARGHKVARFAERQIGVAGMKRGRYVAREAGEELGRLLTPPLTLGGRNLTINAQVHGTLTARVRSADGEPLIESAPVRGDSVAHALRWPRSLARLASHPIRLELRLRQGRVYGFELH